MPLIPPLPPEHDPEVAELSTFFNETLGLVPNSVLTMQRRPDIAKAFIALNKAVMDPSHGVGSELKRLVGYVASHAAGCRYCQAHTALAAQRYGASDAKLAAIWDYQTSPLFSEAERAALDFALAAAAVPNAVTPELGARLRAHWDEGQIVEILGVVALFGFLNRWNDSMATTLEDDAVDFASDHLAGFGWSRGKHG
ncbi:MAG: carboxymuconolactone decarboxylase family protein [Kiloniellales bacterium]|nr:carboxymuconolactone decarboxylase family protein [Kiloniellales bacterium]